MKKTQLHGLILLLMIMALSVSGCATTG
ncbi:MAG: hypothetical protein H6Q49_1581, partial [Deltaproteobacteria bacterium]|nr:hypothetical protein [Deltaproteobacteria bacterium]